MQNIKLIQKIAWAFCKSTGIDYKELFSEACLWYYEAVRTYSPSKGTKLTSYAWTIMKNKLIDYTAKEKVGRKYGIYKGSKEVLSQSYQSYQIAGRMFSLEVNELEMDSMQMNAPESLLTFQPEPCQYSDFLASLPIECKEFAEAVIEIADQIPNDLPPKMARGKVLELLKAKGWSVYRVRASIRQMKKILTT
jgi:DNA-directed RNA polymerase specialized sigma24 family protein